MQGLGHVSDHFVTMAERAIRAIDNENPLEARTCLMHALLIAVGYPHSENHKENPGLFERIQHGQANIAEALPCRFINLSLKVVQPEDEEP
jgi:hypothetical protein